MELVFNENEIKNQVIPAIKNAKRSLDTAKDILISTSIPSDFYHGFKLRNINQTTIPNVCSKVTNINSWLNNSIEKFADAERKSTNAMNNMVSSIASLTLNLSGGKSTTGSKVTNKTVQPLSGNLKKFNNRTKIIVSSIKSAFLKQDWIFKANDSIKNTGAKVVSKVKSAINWIKSTGAKVVAKAKNFFCETLPNFIKDVGAKVKDFFVNKFLPFLEKAVDILLRVGASIANVYISFIKGIWQFIESLFDVIVMLGAGLASIFTGIWDGITYLASDNKEKWESTTSKMWKGTMGFVAEDHVGNVYSSFFKESEIGKWLDENAFEAFKSDGVVCGISSGLGYVAGIIILTVVTAGIGTGAVAASTSTTVVTQATIATISGIGKYTQESWAAKRDSSWEGIERMYQKGEISEEQFNSYIMIRELTDAEWAEIEQDYKNGLISEEEYNAMKQIREMPDDWKTLENGLKGLVYGVANGVWEGVQWYIGGKLAGWTIKSGSKVVTSAVRVGVDTGFNALDTPFRTTVEALTSDKTWKEVWTEQGGLKTVLTDTIIGLIGSVGGESFDAIKTKIKTNNYDNAFKQGTKVDEVIDVAKDNKSYKDFDLGSYEETAKRCAKYFGEQDDNISNLISQQIDLPDGDFKIKAKTANEVLNSLKGKEKIQFQEFLSNTPQGKYYAKLTEDEIKAIRMYSYKGDGAINSALRNGTASEVDIDLIEKACGMKFEDVVNSLDSAIKKYGGLDENMIIYRGINEDAVLKISGLEEQYWADATEIDMENYDHLFASLKALEGGKLTLSDDAFLSTSLNKNAGIINYGHGNDFVLKIQAKKGTPGAYIDLLSNFPEQEFLLSPHQKIKMESVEKQIWGESGLEKIVINCSIE